MESTLTYARGFAAARDAVNKNLPLVIEETATRSGTCARRLCQHRSLSLYECALRALSFYVLCVFLLPMFYALFAGGGCDGLSNRFGSVFWYLNVLSASPYNGVQQLTRQSRELQ